MKNVLTLLVLLSLATPTLGATQQTHFISVPNGVINVEKVTSIHIYDNGVHHWALRVKYERGGIEEYPCANKEEAQQYLQRIRHKLLD